MNWLEMRGKPWQPSTSPGTHARHTPHHLLTLEGVVMALRQKYYLASSWAIPMPGASVAVVEAQAPQLYQVWTLFVFFAES